MLDKENDDMHVRLTVSLRDWFAGQIVPALIAANHNSPPEDLAYQAYRRADAMLEKRA